MAKPQKTHDAATCARCNVAYPAELLVPMMVDGAYTPPICGICALGLANETHGDNRQAFTGPRAEALRQDALAWRRHHR